MSTPAGVHTRDDLTKDQTIFADVVIVGSGAGGATLAAELAEEGVDVVMIEEGGYNTEFDARASHSIRRLYRDAGATMSLGNPPVLYQEGMTVGGSAVINGGMKWRTPENILQRWDVEDGLDRIGPDDMDFFFSRVEDRINVAYQDPETIGRDNALLKEGADKNGWEVIPNRRNQLHCAGSNNCAFGCPVQAKRSPIVTYIPRSLHFGARIYANVRVDRILRRGKRAVGVEGRVVRANGRPGAKITVAANLVVSSCGSIHTPALLHRSGFRSPSGQLGRNLSMHPNVKVLAIFDEDIRGWEGVHQAYQVREFKQEGFVFAAVNIPPSIVAMTAPHFGQGLAEVMADYNKMVVAGLLLEDTSLGRVVTMPGGKPMAFYQLNKIDFEKLRRGLELLCDLLFSVGAKRVLLPVDGLAEPRSADEARKILATSFPRSALEVVTVHLMGTARMGVDRRWAVTDSYGMFHDAAGLMICDASLFPSPIGVNPCLTIQALATRNAAHILDNRQRYLQ
jgi:choline dehydrogenase-like flavoprotein